MANIAYLGSRPSVMVPSYYVSPTGSDSNPGSFASPVQTLGRAANLMNTTAIKITNVFAGTYAPTSFDVDSNQSWYAYPGDAPFSAVINLSNSRSGANANNGRAAASNIIIKGFRFNGVASDGNGLLEFDQCNGVNVWGNRFNLTNAEQALVVFNPQNSKFQGNTINGPGNNSVNAMSVISTNGATMQSNIVSDNTINGSDRFAIEWIFTSPAAMQSCHLDRNTINTPHGTAGFGAISFVGSTSGSNTGNTAIGNICLNTAANTENIVGMEIGVAGTTVQGNTVNFFPFAISVGGNINGTAVLGNSIQMSTVYTPGGMGALTPDGGYNSTEWIGTNTIIGSSSNSVIGCVSGATGFCTLGHGAYGAQPTLFAASPVYTG